MRHDGLCDFNHFHPSEPRCRAVAGWVTDETKLPCTDHEFLRAVTWCDEHRHASDRLLNATRDLIKVAPAPEAP